MLVSGFTNMCVCVGGWGSSHGDLFTAEEIVALLACYLYGTPHTPIGLEFNPGLTLGLLEKSVGHEEF